jgi:EAL domain-containing protein (putative c-di-GMP-specific phosphodiesterase class I)
VRWNHPTRGLLGPDDFLDLAEKNGSIVRLGTWVLDEACHQAKQWKDRFRDHPLTMAVNVSPRQLFECDIVSVVSASLERAGLPAADVVLELTEGVMVKSTQPILDRLHGLKDLGVQLAIDDFGTGYSSLSYLRQLPFDILKIDKLFIDGIAVGPTESAFAIAIIKLAQTLGLEMVAEGVEDVRQAAVLRELGCDTAQGFYFSKPLPAAGVEAILTATGRDRWHDGRAASAPIVPTI